MPQLILNAGLVELPSQEVNLLSWLRENRLTAAKPGCLGGDCGACQVLLGEIPAGEAKPLYRAVNSCLLTTGLVSDCHLITVEGLSDEVLTPVQEALVESGAIQCGYCTPGLVTALTAAMLNGVPPLAAAAGNLCRCTGYAGIRRACAELTALVPQQPLTLAEASEAGLVRGDTAAAATALRPLPLESADARVAHALLAGDTDHAVRQAHEKTAHAPWLRLHRMPSLRALSARAGVITIGAAVTVAELQASAVIARAWPALPAFLDRFGSPAVRQLATVGGNLANASPVADLAVLLLAMDAELAIDGPDGRRDLPLADFFHGYRRTDLAEDELLVSITIPGNADASRRLHAEKVAKRTYDDIASVASAMVVTGGDAEHFGVVRLSAGGVAPVPLLLPGVAAGLSGRPVTAPVVRNALDGLGQAIAPIDDVRGSAAYKAGLLRHLVAAQVAALYPGFDVWGCLR